MAKTARLGLTNAVRFRKKLQRYTLYYYNTGVVVCTFLRDFQDIHHIQAPRFSVRGNVNKETLRQRFTSAGERVYDFDDPSSEKQVHS